MVNAIREYMDAIFNVELVAIHVIQDIFEITKDATNLSRKQTSSQEEAIENKSIEK